jgi:hypothetical protein
VDPGREGDRGRAVLLQVLRFGITVEPDTGPVSLEVRGPAGTREFLTGLLDL